MSATIKIERAGDARLRGNGKDPALPPQAPQSKAGGQPKRASRRGACVYCHYRRCKCDYADGKIPCTACEGAGIDDCQPYQPIPRQPPPPRPRPSSSNMRTPATPGTPADPAAMSSSRPVRGPQRTAQEQADYEARNRFDTSDSESDERPPEYVRQLTLRGQWAARQTGVGSTIEPQYHIPAGDTRTMGDVIRGEHVMRLNQQTSQPAQRGGMRSIAEIEAEEEVVDEDLDGPVTRILQPDQIMQLANDNAHAILEQADIFAPPDADIPLSNATPLTQVQLAGQEFISKNKKRRRQKKKAKPVVDLESANTAESSDAQASFPPAPSSATASFQSATVQDEDDDGTSTARSTPPPARRPAAGGVTTAKPTRKRGKKNNGRNTQQIVEDGDLLPDQGERHYEDQPFLLCCRRIGVSHPVNDRDHGNLMTLARRVAGTFPGQLVVGPKGQYGVVWCDFNIIFGLAYHITAIGERGINFYGTDNWASGEITEILVQAPETVSSVEAPRVQIECLVRQRHSVDFVCPGHDAHTFTLFEVQWQGQGEAKSREVIRKLCEDTGRDFAQTLRKYRIEKLHMHL
ncbi:hypothetical protein DL98DRAFT_659247 [Cadophora sp. DSE1049]|nr:hypothetical protein DL98DRAFT_659247 [Cadophora sp. DSE1049]